MQGESLESSQSTYGFENLPLETHGDPRADDRQILDIELRTARIEAKALGTFLLGLDAALNIAARNFVVQQPYPSEYAEGRSGGFLQIEIVEMRTGSLVSKLRIVWDKTCKHPVGSKLIAAAVGAVFTATASLAGVSFPLKDEPPAKITLEEQVFRMMRELSKSDKDITAHFQVGDIAVDYHHTGKRRMPRFHRRSRYRDPT